MMGEGYRKIELIDDVLMHSKFQVTDIYYFSFFLVSLSKENTIKSLHRINCTLVTKTPTHVNRQDMQATTN